MILRLSAAVVSGMLSFSWIMGRSSRATVRLRDERPRDDIVAGVILEITSATNVSFDLMSWSLLHSVPRQYIIKENVIP